MKAHNKQWYKDKAKQKDESSKAAELAGNTRLAAREKIEAITYKKASEDK